MPAFVFRSRRICSCSEKWRCTFNDCSISTQYHHCTIHFRLHCHEAATCVREGRPSDSRMSSRAPWQAGSLLCSALSKKRVGTMIQGIHLSWRHALSMSWTYPSFGGSSRGTKFEEFPIAWAFAWNHRRSRSRCLCPQWTCASGIQSDLTKSLCPGACVHGMAPLVSVLGTHGVTSGGAWQSVAPSSGGRVQHNSRAGCRRGRGW